MEDKVIIELYPAPARRGLALVFMITLAFLLMYTAVTLEAGVSFRIGLLAIGVVTMMAARSLARGSRTTILLKPSGLVLSDGTEIARMEDIEKVERGLFALKPSNGFAVKLKTAAPRTWVPGMYWRIGKTIGIGGVTNAGVCKAMADMLASELNRNEA